MTSIRDILASTGAVYIKDFIRHIRGETVVVTLTRGVAERADGWPEKANYAATSFVRDWDSLQIVCP